MIDKSCLTWERGTKIFAYFNLIFVISSPLIAYAFGLNNMVWWVLYGLNERKVQILLALFVLGPIISITFAITLFVGVQHEKPKFLLAYIIYGIMVILLNVVGLYFAAVDYMYCHMYICEPSVIAGVLLVCAMYTLILIVIGKTYRQFQKEKCQVLTKFPEKENLL